VAYDSEQVDETLMNELYSLNPELAKEEKKIININDHLKKEGKNDKPGIR